MSVTAPIIANYDPRWPERFSDLAGLIRAEVDLDVVRLDHIGSTSVPGLGAKDVIDIQVTVHVLDVADGWPDRLGPFERRPDVSRDHVPPGCNPGPEDWMKRYWSSRLPPAHLHVREEGRANQRYALLFRDYLRARPSAALAYEQAKRLLAAQCGDSAAYAEAKDPICDLVVQSAEAWAALTGWPRASPEVILQEMVDAFNGSGLSEAQRFIHDDYLDHQGLGQGPLHGPEGFAEVVRAARSGYRDLVVTVEDVVVTANRVVGRLRWLGVRLSGQHADHQTLEIIHVGDGRAIEHWGGRS